MNEFLKNENEAEPSPVTVSEEIKTAYSKIEFLTKGEDVFLEDYVKMKTEVRDILTHVGLWSAELDKTLDSNLIHLGGLGIALESIGKWMERTEPQLKREQLDWYRKGARTHLKHIGIMSPEWETWIQTGSPVDLDKVGERFCFMSRVWGIVGSHHFMERLTKEEGVRRKGKRSPKRKIK